MFYNYQNELKNLNQFIERLKNYSHEVILYYLNLIIQQSIIFYNLIKIRFYFKPM
jgi:hypothetical protein